MRLSAHVFTELPKADTIEAIEALLPSNVDKGQIEAGWVSTLFINLLHYSPSIVMSLKC